MRKTKLDSDKIWIVDQGSSANTRFKIFNKKNSAIKHVSGGGSKSIYEFDLNNKSTWDDFIKTATREVKLDSVLGKGGKLMDSTNKFIDHFSLIVEKMKQIQPHSNETNRAMSELEYLLQIKIIPEEVKKYITKKRSYFFKVEKTSEWYNIILDVSNLREYKGTDDEIIKLFNKVKADRK